MELPIRLSRMPGNRLRNTPVVRNPNSHHPRKPNRRRVAAREDRHLTRATLAHRRGPIGICDLRPAGAVTAEAHGEAGGGGLPASEHAPDRVSARQAAAKWTSDSVIGPLR